MQRIYLKRHLKNLVLYPVELIDNISETINVLDENYGDGRDVDCNLGGYVLIAENIVDIEVLKQDRLKDIIPEYTDLIECKEGGNYTSSLFLLSSDFSIVVVTTQELFKLLLE